MLQLEEQQLPNLDPGDLGLRGGTRGPDGERGWGVWEERVEAGAVVAWVVAWVATLAAALAVTCAAIAAATMTVKWAGREAGIVAVEGVAIAAATADGTKSAT